MKIDKGFRVSKNVIDGRKETRLAFKKKKLFDDHKRQIIRPEVEAAYTKKANEEANKTRYNPNRVKDFPGENAMKAPAKKAPTEKFSSYKKGRLKKS